MMMMTTMANLQQRQQPGATSGVGSAPSRARLFSDVDAGPYSRQGGAGIADTATASPMDGYGGCNGYGDAAGSAGGNHGSKCFCCPYGYHIDLDFVRYCETWQSAASDRIARGNEEKRRRRARQKQRQSMEFLLGFTIDDAVGGGESNNNNNNSGSSSATNSTIAKQSSRVPSPTGVSPSPTRKPAPPKPPPKPSLDSLRQNQDWQDTLSNFEEALSQSYTGPSSSACSTPVHGQYTSSTSDWHSRLSSSNGVGSPAPAVAAEPPASAHRQSQPCLTTAETREPRSDDSLTLSSSRLLLQQLQQQKANGSITDAEKSSLKGSAGGAGELKPAASVNGGNSLQSVREQMATALERMKQLEEQVKEIPMLHVQMSVLREERKILLKQLASQRRLSGAISGQQVSKRDATTSCAVVTRDVGITHQQTKTRETSTNTRPATLSRHVTEATTISPTASRPQQQTKSTQCFDLSIRPTRLSKSTQCASGDEARPSCSSVATQCGSGDGVKKDEKVSRAVQARADTRDRGTASSGPGLLMLGFGEPGVQRKNQAVQATESQPWTKLKLSQGCMAKPQVLDASTETQDHSLSLITFRRQQQSPYLSGGSRTVGTSVGGNELVRSVSRATETQRAASRDFGTSPQRKLLVDVSVGASLPPVIADAGAGTNYCDECKQIRKSLSERSAGGVGKVPALQRRNSDLGVQRTRVASARGTRIPVSEAVRNERRTTLIRQDTWTESLDKLGDGSQSLDKYAADRLLVGAPASEKQPQSNGGAKRSSAGKNDSNTQQQRPDTPKRLNVVKQQQQQQRDSGGMYEIKKSQIADATAEKAKELEDDADLMVSSIVLETPKTPASRLPMELSREMKAALKVLDDNLRKVSSGGTLPAKVKNASNIVQHEWFKVSSTAQADPHGVEFHLDQFEQLHSAALLHHVVNLVDASGNTAMHYAVSHGNFDVVSILLDSKVCDVNRSNNAGYTPVMLAALAQVRNSTHASVVKRLFQMADVNVRARLHGQTALMLAVSHGRRDMSKLLIDAGAAVNLQDEDGSTALMCAAEHGHGEIVRLLLAHPDCDSSIVDVDGSSALKIALEAGHADIGVLLYAHQRANRNSSPMPLGLPSALPVPARGRRQRTNSTSGHHHHHGHHSGSNGQYSALSMSAPASPVAAGARKFHSSSLSLVDAPKYSL